MGTKWEQIKDPDEQAFWRKRGIKNGTVDVSFNWELQGWIGTFIHESDSKQNHRIEEVFPNNRSGIIDCKHAIAMYHARKYTMRKPDHIYHRTVRKVLPR